MQDFVHQQYGLWQPYPPATGQPGFRAWGRGFWALYAKKPGPSALAAAGPQIHDASDETLDLRKYRWGLKKWGLKPPEITPG